MIFEIMRAEILNDKYYSESSVFLPENLLREARRQRNLPDCEVPAICLLDPDGDLTTYLQSTGQAEKSKCWACYHSSMYTFMLDGVKIGVVPCIVGSSYAVLVAEQLFASGCKVLISVTSAGIISRIDSTRQYALITSAIRDEGTSYHYLPADLPSELSPTLLNQMQREIENNSCPYFAASSWTTDAPYRETETAIHSKEKQNVCCVEMEAAALYAFAKAKDKQVICFAHLTNTMAQQAGDFEKGEHFGSLATLNLVSYTLKQLQP